MQGARPHDRSVRAARDLLGVAADADPAQLARAYRRRARRLHPDISLEPDATERFWALQAAYHLALEAAPGAAPDAARPTTSMATTSTTAAPITIEHRDPTVSLGTSPTRGFPAATRNGVRRHVAWLVAGPVHVEPAHRAVSGAASPTSPGALW
jgi:hypothetical protein